MRLFLKLLAIVALLSAAFAVQAAATAAPSGSTRLVGAGSTVWGVWGEGSQSFSVNVFTTPHGLGGHIKWQGVKATDGPAGPLVRYSYSGHPDCLAVAGNIAVTSVVRYSPSHVFPYQGAVVIAVDDGSVDRAWGELLEAGDQQSAKSVCSSILDSLGGFGPLPTLDGAVTLG